MTDESALGSDEPTGTPDVKTAPDGTPIQRTASPAQWEAVGRRALADVLRNRQERVTREAENVVAAIEYGAPVDEDHVRNLRGAIETLELAVEARLAGLVDGVEPWERTAGRVPYGRLYETLGIDEEDLERLRAERPAEAAEE